MIDSNNIGMDGFMSPMSIYEIVGDYEGSFYHLLPSAKTSHVTIIGTLVLKPSNVEDSCLVGARKGSTTRATVPFVLTDGSRPLELGVFKFMSSKAQPSSTQGRQHPAIQMVVLTG